jgi:hypothetical protein
MAMRYKPLCSFSSMLKCYHGTLQEILKIMSVSVCVCICILALVIRYKKSMGMRRIIISSVAFLSVHYFSTFSHKRQHFREIVTQHEMCVFILSTTFV